jgi:hypothetical protein
MIKNWDIREIRVEDNFGVVIQAVCNGTAARDVSRAG